MYSGEQQTRKSKHLKHRSILFEVFVLGVNLRFKAVCNGLDSVRGYYTKK